MVTDVEEGIWVHVICETRKGQTRSKYVDGGCCMLESGAGLGMDRSTIGER